MNYGSEYMLNIKEDWLKQRYYRFTSKELFQNYSNFLSLSFDWNGIEKQVITKLIKKYSKRPPVKNLHSQLKKYNVKIQEVVPYCAWLYFEIGYSATTLYMSRLLAERIFGLPVSVLRRKPLKEDEYDPRIEFVAKYIFNHGRQVFTINGLIYSESFINLNNFHIDSNIMIPLFNYSVGGKYLLFPNKDYKEIAEEKGWIKPVYLRRLKTKESYPINFDPFKL